MLTNIRVFAPHNRVNGFSLIELMISIVVGMLVVAGATKLIVAINQSNADTITSARLTQELRTTLEVIAADLRRARRVDDPIGQIGAVAVAQAQTPPQTHVVATDAITAPAAGCIKYGYEGQENNAASTVDTTRKTPYYHAVYRKVNSGVGSVVLVSDTTAGNVTCTANPTATLSSSQVDITSLSFNWPASPSTQVSSGAVIITISGRPQFRSGDNYNITRTLTQTVDVRSAKSGT
jgi:Tfp pilus assembly protein PilW